MKVDWVYASQKASSTGRLGTCGIFQWWGKGDHTVWVHPLVSGHVSVDGKDGDYAKPYDERNLRRALRDLEQARQHRGQQP